MKTSLPQTFKFGERNPLETIEPTPKGLRTFYKTNETHTTASFRYGEMGCTSQLIICNTISTLEYENLETNLDMWNIFRECGLHNGYWLRRTYRISTIRWGRRGGKAKKCCDNKLLLQWLFPPVDLVAKWWWMLFPKKGTHNKSNVSNIGHIYDVQSNIEYKYKSNSTPLIPWNRHTTLHSWR